jgi:hypothetical protein
MKQNLRIKRSDTQIEVAPDGGDWLLSIDERGAQLWRAVTGADDEHGTNPVEGWMPAEIVDAMDRGDDDLVKMLLDRWQPEERMQTP